MFLTPAEFFLVYEVLPCLLFSLSCLLNNVLSTCYVPGIVLQTGGEAEGTACKAALAELAFQRGAQALRRGQRVNPRALRATRWRCTLVSASEGPEQPQTACEGMSAAVFQ